MTRVAALLFHDVYRLTPEESGFAGRAADHYKLSLSAFDAQFEGLQACRPKPPDVLEPAPLATDDEPRFAITVDDGGVSFYTIVADRLETLGWRAHCLVTTDSVGRRGFLSGSQLRELRARGHLIGTHSVSHPPRFSACSRPQMLHEWRDSRRMLADLLGEDVVVGSVPAGDFSTRVAETAAEAGLRILFTSKPTIRTRTIAGCLVVGRFTVRPDSAPDFSARVCLSSPTLRVGEWATWQAKAVARSTLRGLYPRLTARWAAWAARKAV